MRGEFPPLPRAVHERLLAREVYRGGSTREEFAGREDELRRYLDRSSGRLTATLALLDRSGLPAGARVLELGADPWLFTQLLLERGLDVVSAGLRPGVWTEDTAATPQTVDVVWNGRRAHLEHHLFNVERDRWPFPDGAFRAVLCMEVVEHLVFSPSHMLYEAARVLAPDGLLLVTTPNGVAATKLAKLLRGRNIHGPYSGYGSHGRHNRELAPEELETLVSAVGFDAEVRAENVSGYEADEPLGRILRSLAGLLLPARRDHLLALARRNGPPQLAFPEPLYRSVDRERLRAQGVLLPDE